MSLVHRITMFKVVGLEKQKQLLAAYEKLAKVNEKDGKPYIVYMCAGLSNPEDPRHRGYTVISQSKFKSLEDMKYYDEGCAGHAELKGVVRSLGMEELPVMVYYEETPAIDLTHA